MQVFQHRLDSFLRPKRVKTGPKSTTSLKWPHPKQFQANPETLAEAGFYFDPSVDDKDLVTCYMCGKQLGEWAKDDDPFEIHLQKCAKTCSWAFLRCGLGDDLDKQRRFSSTDKTRHPTSKAMEKARLDTFGKWWKYDGSISSKKMAQAGFIYSPLDDQDDLVICVYCDTSLSGWEKDDDPL
ncbi:inhibitor of apoptosis repeat-containing protein, partial [Hymenopellis radicata]